MTASSYYSRFPEELEDRFDFNYNSPIYDKITSLLSKARYPIVVLGDSKYLKSITKGKTPKGLHYVADGVPFIGSTQISSGTINLDDAPKIPIEIHNTKLLGSQLKKGYVLITMAGTIGRSASFIYGVECNANQAVAILNINQAEIDSEFLSMYFNSQVGQLFFHKLETVSSQPNINFEQIKQIRVILPTTIEEQRKIVSEVKRVEREAEKLESEFESLVKEAATEMVKELELNESDRTTDYFFKTGEEKTIYFSIFPTELSDRMQLFFFHPKYSILNRFQEKIQTVKLEVACSEPIHRGEQPEYDETGTVTVIKTVNLKDSYVDYDSCLRVSQDFYEKFPSAQIKKNDVLVASTGLISMGKVAVYTRDEPTVVDGHISIIRLKEEYDPFFVAFYLSSHLGQLQFEKWFSGSSGQIEIQPQDLNQFILPSSNENGVPIKKQIGIAKRITRKMDYAWKLKEEAKSKMRSANLLFESLLYTDAL